MKNIYCTTADMISARDVASLNSYYE